VCHLWNLVAVDTREGWVFQTLLHKLEREREALGGQVFDVLGRVFSEKPLRDLLIEAIRYGDRPDVRARQQQVLDASLDRGHLPTARARAGRTMDEARCSDPRADGALSGAPAAAAFIGSFFKAVTRLGGTSTSARKSPDPHVPAAAGAAWRGHAALRARPSKELIIVDGKPLAEFICPGHLLLDAVTS
jgi:hypothetical protein